MVGIEVRGSLPGRRGHVEDVEPNVGPSDRRRGAVGRRWSGLWDGLTVRALLLGGLPPIGVLMLLSLADVGGLVTLWEPAHTTVAGRPPAATRPHRRPPSARAD